MLDSGRKKGEDDRVEGESMNDFLLKRLKSQSKLSPQSASDFEFSGNQDQQSRSRTYRYLDGSSPEELKSGEPSSATSLGSS